MPPLQPVCWWTGVDYQLQHHGALARIIWGPDAYSSISTCILLPERNSLIHRQSLHKKSVKLEFFQRTVCHTLSKIWVISIKTWRVSLYNWIELFQIFVTYVNKCTVDRCGRKLYCLLWMSMSCNKYFWFIISRTLRIAYNSAMGWIINKSVLKPFFGLGGIGALWVSEMLTYCLQEAIRSIDLQMTVSLQDL